MAVDDRDVTGLRSLGLAVAMASGMLLAAAAAAVPIASDDFDYAAGDLVGESGGSGDWKNAWSGDAEIDVVVGGYGYVDALGNTLVTSGNRLEIGAAAGSAKKVERQLDNKLGTSAGTIWLSAVLDGTAASAIHNVGLGDGLFFGQGGKSTAGLTWQLTDKNELVADTGISAANRALLVVRIDFTAGDEIVWLWVDPILSATPGLGAADASFTAGSFEADFIRIQLQTPGSAGFDGFRTGTTFDDVVPFVPAVSEPKLSLLMLAGVLAMSSARRQHP